MVPSVPSATGASGGRPLWRGTSLRADKWGRYLGASAFICRTIRYGVRDMPLVPFVNGEMLPPIPQTEEDKVFARAKIEEGCKEQTIREVTRDYAVSRVASGLLVSSSFVAWQGEGKDRRGRFVINLHKQSKHWAKGSTKMETLPGFALEVEKGDHLISFDVKSGYHHFYLHPDMRDYFLFHYEGRFYQCLALPFGWGRSGLWFTKILRPLVRHLRERCGYRVLPYVDDFLLAPSPSGRAATSADAARARAILTRLFRLLGIVRNKEKGCWQGGQQIDHLGMHVDTVRMRVFISASKIKRIRLLARKMLVLATRNRRLVSSDALRHFCGVAVSVGLGYPLARFFTRSLFFDLTRAESRSKTQGTIKCYNGRVRLSRQSLRDLQHWRCLTREDGRALQPAKPDLSLHTDAADLGYGGTLGPSMEPGARGLWEGQGIWTAADRAQSITLRELRSVRLLLVRSFADYVSDPRIRTLLVHQDNQAVVHVLNAMVSASRPMMAELRKLHAILRRLGVRLDARWLPSAVNRFADSLSRTWDPGDIQVSPRLSREIQVQYRLDPSAFFQRPLNEPRPARLKQIKAQMSAWWGDGRARLWNPPADFLPLVVRKIQQEEGRGVLLCPFWPSQAWFARLRNFATNIHIMHPGDTEGDLFVGKQINLRWAVAVVQI